jgi:hypothetical protein
MKREPTLLLLCVVVIGVTLAGVQATRLSADKHLEHAGMQHVDKHSTHVQAGKHIQRQRGELRSVLKQRGKSTCMWLWLWLLFLVLLTVAVVVSSLDINTAFLYVLFLQFCDSSSVFFVRPLCFCRRSCLFYHP